MKLFSLICCGCCIFCTIFSISAEDPVRLDSAGRLAVTDELLFSGDYWNGKLRRNYTQGKSKEWKIDALQSDKKTNTTTYRGVLSLPDRTVSPFAGKLRKTGGGTSEFELEVKNTKESFTFRTVLPAKLFTGRTLLIDGKEFQLPQEKGKVGIFSGKVRRLEIPCSDGVFVLECDREISIQMQDYRPRPDSYSLLLGMPAADGGRKLQLRLRYQPYSSLPLDLRSAANMGFTDAVASDGKGGWTDQGPENDLRMIPLGKQRWRGTDFEIIDPAKNGGKSCIVLAGPARHYMPEQAAAEVKAKVQGRWLFLLHATAWGSSRPELGTVTLTYQDGTQKKIPVKSGVDAGNWWSPSPRGNGEVVWTGENRSSFVGLYRSCYPIEAKPIRHVEFRSAGNAVWMIVAASVGEKRPPRNMSAPYYIVAGKDWKPIHFNRDVNPGSVLDFSWRLDAPAGKYGPVVVRNGRFEFRDRPGVALRFYGTNLCSAGPFVDRKWAERLADRMAQYGFNMFRLHHHDGGLGRKSPTYELDPFKVDQVDYLVYCLKQRGIYLTTDLYISRRLPAGEIPEYPGKLTDITAYKALFWVLDSVYENWKAHARNYLTHVNPYTKLAIKDDPVLVSINLVNEGNIKSCWSANAFTRKLYNERFEEWRRARNLSDGGNPGERNRQFERFLTETYEKRYAQMVKFVRSLGVRCPLSDQNMGATPKLSLMRRDYDYVDTHGYSSHPRFAGRSWQLPSLVTQKSAIAGQFAVPWHLASSRLFGKPFTVTEFDYAKPNRFRAEGPALIGAYAGLQGWDMLVQFAYSHGTENYQKEGRTRNHFDLSTDLVKSLAQRIGVALFSPAGIQPATKGFAALLAADGKIPFDTNYNVELSQLGQIARVGTLVVPPGTLAALPEDVAAVIDIGTAFPRGAAGKLPVFNAAPGRKTLIQELIDAGYLEKGCYDAASGFYRSLGGAIELNRSKQTFRALSDACEVLILPAGRKMSGSFLAVDNKVGRAVIAAISADGKKLRDSDRILLLHLTDTQATKAKFASPEMEQLDGWGTTPFLAARGEAVLTLAPADGRNYRVYAVDTAGKRLGEVKTLRAKDGKLTLPVRVFQPFGTVLAYELEAVAPGQK